MNEDKNVVLERAVQGSFGFSILGGAGMKYPACVCEVDVGGPADLSQLVMVGDRLLKLNGEDVDVLSPKDLVQRIRQAPSPSSFTLVEDVELRRQVNHILRKKERKAGGRKDRGSTSSEGSISSGGAADPAGGKVRRKISPSYANPLSGGPSVTEDTGRRKKLGRIIEVEPSVNISNGQSEIVQVHRNKIVGKVSSVGEPSSPSTRQSPGRSEIVEDESPKGSPQRDSPGESHRSAYRAGSNSPYQNHKKFSLPDHAGSTPNIPYSTSNNATHHSVGSLDHTPDHAWISSASDGVMNGEVRILSDSSSVTSPSETPAMGSVVSIDDKSNKSSEVGSVTGVVIVEGCSEDRISLQEVQATPLHEEEDDANYDSGVALQIPAWDGHPLSRFGKTPRASLSEEILVGEMSKQGEGNRQDCVEGSPVTADRLRANDVGSSSPQRDRSHQVAKLVKRNSSKKKAGDPYTSAVTMARRLYMLDGYKRSEVAAKLSDPSDHGKTVASEYLKFFEFQDQSLVESLRQFLTHFSLTGESQERERVMVHFSDRYHECNPTEYESVDTVHGITIAVLLLNTDLHTDHGGKKMTSVQFSTNAGQVAKGVPKSLLRSLYDEIKKIPLQWAQDDGEGASNSSQRAMADQDMESSSSSSEAERVYHVTIPGTFVEAELPASAPLFKEGYVLKKNIMEAPHKKVARGRRQWKPYYAYLKGFLLYLQPPRQGDLHFEDTTSALSICHTIAMGAFDYHKKNSVLRVTTSEWQSFLLQANDTMDMQQWITSINRAAATYSSPPLAAAVSSSSGFQRPTFPLTPTRNTVEQQAESHEARGNSLRKEHEEHQAYKPTGSKAKHNDLQNWFDKYEFLQFEINRFQIYFASLFGNAVVDFQTQLPSGLVPSPSISTLATSGTSDGSSELSSWKSVTPPGSPSKRRSERKGSKPGSTSPLVSSKKSHKKN